MRQKAAGAFITNYVTVNDCANMTLALGGSSTSWPMICVRRTSALFALVLNIGTPFYEATADGITMLAAEMHLSQRNTETGWPPVFDLDSRMGLPRQHNLHETPSAMLLREVRFDDVTRQYFETLHLLKQEGRHHQGWTRTDALSTEGIRHSGNEWTKRKVSAQMARPS